MELDLKQNYQKLEATAKLNGRAVPVEQAKLTGRMVEVTLQLPERGRVTFSGRRINQALEGEMRVAGSKDKGVPWSAVRIELRDAAHVIAPPPVIREYGMPQ